MINDWIDFIVFDVKNVIIDDIVAMNKNEFNSRIFGEICLSVVELLRNPSSICALYKNNHKQIGMSLMFKNQLFASHECNFANFLLNFLIGIRKIIITHIVIGFKHLIIEHLDKKTLLISQVLPTQLMRINQVPITINPNII